MKLARLLYFASKPLLECSRSFSWLNEFMTLTPTSGRSIAWAWPFIQYDSAADGKPQYNAQSNYGCCDGDIESTQLRRDCCTACTRSETSRLTVAQGSVQHVCRPSIVVYHTAVISSSILNGCISSRLSLSRVCVLLDSMSLASVAALRHRQICWTRLIFVRFAVEVHLLKSASSMSLLRSSSRHPESSEVLRRLLIFRRLARVILLSLLALPSAVDESTLLRRIRFSH